MNKERKKYKSSKCEWEHERFDDRGKEYVKCIICGRIKRSDLPDAQACTGSKNSHAIMLKKIMGGELVDREIERIEKE
jgi:hypothetical protein